MRPSPGTWENRRNTEKGTPPLMTGTGKMEAASSALAMPADLPLKGAFQNPYSMITLPETG